MFVLWCKMSMVHGIEYQDNGMEEMLCWRQE